jgi:allantoin racemase
MHLGVIVPTTILTSNEVKRRTDAYARCISAGTKLTLVKTLDGPPSTDSRYEEFMAAPHIIATARELVGQGVNSIIINCFGDPAVGALREIFDIPIVGPAEASISMALNLGGKVSIVTILENGVSMLEESVNRMGLGSRLASIRAIGIEPGDLDKDPKRTELAVLREVRSAVKEDHASVVIIGCNTPEMALNADKLNGTVGVPVINPIRAAVAMAESLTHQNLGSSRVTYRRPISLG